VARDPIAEVLGDDLARAVSNNCSILGRHDVRAPDRHNPSGSGELAQESLCLSQVGGIEALDEPAVNRRQ
jgi:hypothetical protein